MNWLVTGGCGFIGRALIRALLAEGGHSIRVLDNLSSGKREDLEEVASTVPLDECSNWTSPLALRVGDIRDATATIHVAEGADIVAHLAANASVGASVAGPRMDCETNVLGTMNALEATRTHGAKRFVFASSVAPLGVQPPPQHEGKAAKPASPYGASKLAGEGYCSAWYHSFGVETVALRFGNVYGEGSIHQTSVVANFIKRALVGETLEIHGDGSQTRDFIHVSDLVRAIRAAATVPGIGGEVFQIATATETTVGALTRRLIAAMQAEGIALPTVVNGAVRTGDLARSVSDTSKAARMLDWCAEINLDDGLRRTVRYFLDRASADEAARRGPHADGTR